MTRPLVRLVLAACLFATVLPAQDVAPFALSSSTTGAEAVLLNPAALADLEGMHGYLGLQQLYQETDWNGVAEGSTLEYDARGIANQSTQAPFAASWNLSDDWAIGIGEMSSFDGGASFSQNPPFRAAFRKFELSIHEWRGATAYRIADKLNVGLALRFLQADYGLSHIGIATIIPPPDGGMGFYPFSAGYSGNKNALGFELSALWKAKGFTLGAVLRPEVKFDFGYSDLSVAFEPSSVMDEATQAIFRTYYPGGGVKSEAILPLEARVAVTFEKWGPWRFSGELGWAQWSKWETVSLDYANNTVDPQTGDPILADTRFNTNFQDAFSLTGMAAHTFDNAIVAYGRLGWQGKICDDPYGATLRPNDGAIITLGGRYPWKFGEFALAVDAFYSFGVYSSNNGFDMSRNLLGAGLSVAF